MSPFTKDNVRSAKKKLGKTVKKGKEYTGDAAHYLMDHKEGLVGAAVGAASGAVSVYNGIKGYTVSDSDIKNEIDRIQEQSRYYNQLTTIYNQKLLHSPKVKEIVLDSLIASSAAAYASTLDTIQIPEDVQLAYELAYPLLSDDVPLEDIIQTATDKEAIGYMAAIKGKLFELHYVNELNNTPGALPRGFEASLAQSSTNPGWDIQITDANGHIDSVLQLKATNSLDYIQEALNKYPDIDVVTTSEVYNQVAMHEFSDRVFDSGISNDELTDMVVSTFTDADASHISWLPGTLPYLLNLYLAQRKQGLTFYEKSEVFGKRSFRTWLFSSLAGAAISATGFIPLGLIIAPVTGIALAKGELKQKRFKELQQIRKQNETGILKLIFKLTSI